MNCPIYPEQWEERKEEIMRLYFDVDMPLKSVMKAVRDNNFSPRCHIIA